MNGKEMPVKSAVFPDDRIMRFKRLVAERCGLCFKDHDLRSLKGAVDKRRAICGIEGLEEYYGYLMTSRNGEDEFIELLNLLTVNHTYFFRNEPHFRALARNVLPGIIRRKRETKGFPGLVKPSLRIWSAGCSTGEEPYSIAMVVRDTIGNLDEWDIEILASDVSTDALRIARKGVYGGNSLRLVDSEHLRMCFEESQRGERRYALNDEVKRMVRFDFLNLVTDSFPSDLDIIFCRNVFIYFKPGTILAIADRLHSSLRNDGYLFAGYSENMQSIYDKFRMEEWGDALYYRKKIPDPVDAPRIPRSFGRGNRDGKMGNRASMVGPGSAHRTKKKTPRAEKQTIEEMTGQIVALSNRKEYEKARSLIEAARGIDANAVELYYLEAEIDANQGKPDEARVKLETIVESSPCFAPAYYLLGSLSLDSEDTAEARRKLKQALYLDGNFSMARFLLGITCRDDGRVTDAIREFRNTIRSLDGLAPDDIIPYSGGFSAMTLDNVCKDNIERLRSGK